tara:strand:+ start:332 stop:853 length:522 start_codon:yes stop_codon:yes gene_type:complete
MSEIFLISGGRKSGKSKFAEKIASKFKKVTYVALSETRENDTDWQNRIELHKLRRPNNWNTIETNEIVKVLKNETEVLLIDSIGGFVLKGITMNSQEWDEYKCSLIECLSNYKNTLIIVGEQVGWGLVSEYKIGNLFADRLGEIMNQITEIADQNWLAINGKALRLDDIFIDI